ncbi:MAG TPA: hypothetical protein VER11_26975, partial [Polyangiaceae bacterium]|nr:hypothetical protein [Polyangiaceae bacterium]
MSRKSLVVLRQSLATGLLIAQASCSSKAPSDANNGGTPNSSGHAGAAGVTSSGGASGMSTVGAAGTLGNLGGAGSAGASANSEPFINSAGKLTATGNSFGLQGYWYAYADGVTSTQSG